MNVEDFIFNNIEYIVAIVGIPVAFLLVKSGKHHNKRSNLSRFEIQAHKQKEAINKKSKSSLF